MSFGIVVLNHKTLWLLLWLLLTWHLLGPPSPPRPDSGCSCELGACCRLHGQVWEMPGGLAGFSVAFGSSLSHMVLKCQTVPKCGSRLRRCQKEVIVGLLISQPPQPAGIRGFCEITVWRGMLPLCTPAGLAGALCLWSRCQLTCPPNPLCPHSTGCLDSCAP